MRSQHRQHIGTSGPSADANDEVVDYDGDAAAAPAPEPVEDKTMSYDEYMASKKASTTGTAGRTLESNDFANIAAKQGPNPDEVFFSAGGGKQKKTCR